MSWLRVALVVPLAAAVGCGRPGEGETTKREAPGASAATRRVTLSAAARGAAGIRVVAVARGVVLPSLELTGVLRADPQRSVAVRARTGGRVLGVLVDVGSRVAAGQVLATLEGAEVSAALARDRAAEARASAARQSLVRAQRLLDVRAISRAERDARQAEAQAATAEADAARQDLERLGLDPTRRGAARGLPELQIVSPVAGTVLERAASPGVLVEREAPLFVVADLARLWAVLDVYEKDLDRVAASGAVAIRSDAVPGAVFQARLALVEPTVDEASRLGHLRVVLDNPGGRLRPGLTVTASVPVRGSAAEALVVPVQAVQRLAGAAVVFVEDGEGRFELRPVETGRESGGVVEVRRGLASGERVVVDGAFTLKAELLKSGLGEEDEPR